MSHNVVVGGQPQEARTTWAAISRFFNPSISLSNGVPFLELAKKRGPPFESEIEVLKNAKCGAQLGLATWG